jgi:hypothetical protein
MKANVNRIIKDGDKYYRLEKGKEIPEMSAKTLKTIKKLGYIEKSETIESEVIADGSGSN